MTEQDFGLFKRKNGIFYYTVYVDGVRKQHSTGKRKRHEALAFCNALVFSGTLEMTQMERFSDQSVFEVFAKDFFIYGKCPYIQGRLARGYGYSQKLAKSNRGYFENYILPYFTGRAVSSISVGDVNRWLLSLPKLELSHKTCNNILTLMRQILEVALEDGLVERNVAKIVKPLCEAATAKRRVAFTMDQIHQLFSEPWKSNIAEAACRLAAMTGMRSGEIRALQQYQVHESFIEVDASYNNNDDGRKTTKSGYSRIVPINREIHQLIQKINSGGLYVFSFDGDNPVANTYFEKWLKKKMDELHMEPKPGTLLSFHSFRHYLNSRLVAAGIQGDKIRAVIGHETEDMTEHYSHLEPEDLKQVLSVQDIAIA